MLSRRQFLQFGLYGAAFGVGGISYSYFIEARWLKITEHYVNIDSALIHPITLLHLSDFHASPAVPLDFIEEACRLVTTIKADCVCLTGDYLTKTLTEPEIIRYSQILQILTRHAPTFACLGNHDGGEWATKHHGYSDIKVIRQILQNAGVHLLHNDSTLFDIAQQTIKFIGVGDSWTKEYDPQAAFSKLAHINAPTILLSHNPDTKANLINYEWDLLLCGHTHGGQFVIPFTNFAPFAPVKDKKYLSGLFSLEKRYLHITTGIGNLHGLRFNCRPEIGVLHLNPVNSDKTT